MSGLYGLRKLVLTHILKLIIAHGAERGWMIKQAKYILSITGLINQAIKNPFQAKRPDIKLSIFNIDRSYDEAIFMMKSLYQWRLTILILTLGYGIYCYERKNSISVGYNDLLYAKVCTYCNRVVKYPESEFAMLGDNSYGFRCLSTKCSEKHDFAEAQRFKQIVSIMFPTKNDKVKYKWLKKIFKWAGYERNKDK